MAYSRPGTLFEIQLQNTRACLLYPHLTFEIMFALVNAAFFGVLQLSVGL